MRVWPTVFTLLVPLLPLADLQYTASESTLIHSTESSRTHVRTQHWKHTMDLTQGKKKEHGKRNVYKYYGQKKEHEKRNVYSISNNMVKRSGPHKAVESDVDCSKICFIKILYCSKYCHMRYLSCTGWIVEQYAGHFNTVLRISVRL